MSAKVIIIIGLPGSGKTTYANMNYDEEYVIFDDFVTKFFNGLVIKNIKLNNKVCLIDPRLCDIDIFNRYLNELLKYVELDKIKIIAFENDKKTCLINIVKRNDKRNVSDTIINYSKIYSIDNYKKYDPLVISCWK